MFSFAPQRILVEQLRLVHANAPVSFLATGIFSLLLVWLLSTDTSRVLLLVWAIAVWMMIVVAALLTRHLLRRLTQFGQGAEAAHTHAEASVQVRRSALLTVYFYACYGALWGMLPWLALTPPTPLATAVVVWSLAGIVGGGMTFMAPVLPAFLCFAISTVLPTAIKLVLQAEAEYIVLGLGSLLYVGATLVQAGAASRVFRSTIELRFENVALVERLQRETDNAVAAHAEAEEANLAKSKFLAAASHDLRQPVHAQGLFLEVLARTELSAHQREVLVNARAAGTASAEMLNTLLDFSRIEAGVIRPQLIAFRLQPLLNKLEVELAQQADTKGIVYRSRETHAVVLSDPALVELILRNLVSNAIRYTETGGVLVGCRTRGSGIVIEVWDTGIGIAPEHQGDVFREFHQLGNPERDRQKGLGLGLAIAMGLATRLAEVQSGHALTLASTPGRGSVFRLAVPLTRQVVAADDAPRSGGNLRLLNLRVLVIDDDATVRNGMQRLLHDWGARCDVAGSIDEALALLRAQGASGDSESGWPDLVISDYRLREQRTGAEAIAAIRSAVAGEFGDAFGVEPGAQLPALLITGDTAPERLREAQATGVMLLHKPVAPSDLYRAIAQVLD